MLLPTQVAVDVDVFRCVCLMVCITLGPIAAIRHGEQNCCSWHGAADKILRQLTAYEVYGG